MQDIAVRSPLPIAKSQPNQPLQSVIESSVDEEADGGAHENLHEARAEQSDVRAGSVTGASRSPSRGWGSRQASRGTLLSGGTPGIRGATPSWGTPPPSRLIRTPSQEQLITKLRYKEVLDWIGGLPLPHIKKLRGPVRPETLRNGNLLWDIALHVLRPDLPNNRDEIEQYENLLDQPDVVSSTEKKCKALRYLGQSYHQMSLYGSAIEMHTLHLRFGSALEAGGTLEMMQQAIGDLGDVFRSLGEKEVAQNLYKSNPGIPNRRQKAKQRGDTPGGGLDPWPNTPLGVRDPISSDSSGKDKIKAQTNEVFGRKNPGKSAPERRPKTQRDHNSSTEGDQSTFDELEELPFKEVFWPDDLFEGIDGSCLTVARRVLDIFNLVREVCGVQISEAWPYRAIKEIQQRVSSDPPSRLQSMTGKAFLKPTNAASEPALDGASAGSARHQDSQTVRIRTSGTQHSDDSGDDTYLDDFLDRPGTGIIDEGSSGGETNAPLSGDEAMWIAWYLCWYTKHCEAPPPERSTRHEVDVTASASTPRGEVEVISSPTTMIAPNMDFEARFGHLRKENMPSQSILTRSKANWHRQALAFVGMEGHDRHSRTLSMSGQHVPGKAVSALASGGFSPNTIRSAQGFAAKFSKEVVRSARESEWVKKPMFIKGQGPVSPLPQATQPPNSLSRSTTPHRPTSRQLPAERWDSFSLGKDSPHSAIQFHKSADDLHGRLGGVSPQIHKFAGEPGVRSKSPPASMKGHKSDPNQEDAMRPFTEADLFVDGPEDDDGFPERVLMSDAFSWQKLDAVSVSSVSSCGRYGIITLVAGSRVGVFTTSPFKRVAEIHRKDASFTCATGCISLSFVREVFRMNVIRSHSLRVDVPEGKTRPSESDNFIVAGESCGQVVVADARTGVTRQTLVQEGEGLGAVIMLNLLGEGTAGLLYCAHKNGTLTLWSIRGIPSMVWRTQACSRESSLSGAYVMRSCVVTRDENESCLRVWKLKIQRPHRQDTKDDMLQHEVLHQQTRISSFTGYQEPRKTSDSSPMIVSGGRDGTVQVWGSQGTLDKDAPTLLFGHTKTVTSLYAFSRSRICSGSVDHTCRVWNPKSAKCSVILSGHSSAVTNVWCDDSQIVTAEVEGQLRVWSNNGSCICVLQGEVSPETPAPQPIELLVFRKPLIFVIQDLDGGVTIWGRDHGLDARRADSLSPVGNRRFVRLGVPSLDSSPKGDSEEMSQMKAAASTSHGKRLRPPTTAATHILNIATRGTVLGDDSDEKAHAEMMPEYYSPPARRMWWGSREDRVPQLWPTGKPWQSIVKGEKQRPPGLRSREGTPSTAQSRRSRSVGPRESAVDLGRMTSPVPFSPQRMLPEVSQYPLWMGRGEFVPEVAPDHYPGAPRRSGLPQVSLDSSRQALIQENIDELERQMKLLNKKGGDYILAQESIAFLRRQRYM